MCLSYHFKLESGALDRSATLTYIKMLCCFNFYFITEVHILFEERYDAVRPKDIRLAFILIDKKDLKIFMIKDDYEFWTLFKSYLISHGIFVGTRNMRFSFDNF